MQIPFFKLDKSNYPKYIMTAQKYVFKWMVEEPPTYLIASSTRPIKRQRELEEDTKIEQQKEISPKN